jgi:hypothetical protein
LSLRDVVGGAVVLVIQRRSEDKLYRRPVTERLLISFGELGELQGPHTGSGRAEHVPGTSNRGIYVEKDRWISYSALRAFGH